MSLVSHGSVGVVGVAGVEAEVSVGVTPPEPVSVGVEVADPVSTVMVLEPAVSQDVSAIIAVSDADVSPPQAVSGAPVPPDPVAYAVEPVKSESTTSRIQYRILCHHPELNPGAGRINCPGR